MTLMLQLQTVMNVLREIVKICLDFYASLVTAKVVALRIRFADVSAFLSCLPLCLWNDRQH